MATRTIQKMVGPSADSRIVQVRCSVCKLPESIREHVESLYADGRVSLDAVRTDYADRLPQWITDGQLPESSPVPSKSTFYVHFRDHAPLTINAEGADVLQATVIQTALKERADLFLTNANLFKRLHSMLQDRLTLLESLYSAEAASLTGLKEEMERYVSDMAAWSDLVAQEIEDGVPRTTPRPVPPRITSIFGLEIEERRILNLLGQVRSQAAEAAKIVSFEESFLGYVKLEVDKLLRDMYSGLLDQSLTFQEKLSPTVPPDKHDFLRKTLRDFVHTVQGDWQVRYRTLLRDISTFIRNIK